MRKKLRLTESELVGLVKKVIEEQTVYEQVEEMDEQTQMPGFTPQMNQLYDFIKNNKIEMGAVVKVMEFMKSAKPVQPNQQASQTIPKPAQQGLQKGADFITAQQQRMKQARQAGTVR